jgi:hypothetical protein
MKFGTVLLSSAIASALPGTLAHPGSQWAKKMTEIEAEIVKRAAAPDNSPEDSNELLGDLVKPGPTTPVGKVCLMRSSLSFNC